MSIRERLFDVDRSKGIAIFLVVLGHIVSRQPPEGNAWFVELKHIIYLFHMPFFMFVSGVTISYSYRGIHSTFDYFVYVKQKFERLAPAFFLFGILILFGKFFAAKFMHVDNLNEDIINQLVNLMIRPTQSASSSLWYIYVLMELCIIFPLIMLLGKARIYNTIPFAIILYFIDGGDYLMLNSLFKYLLFFLLGAFAAQDWNSFTKALDNNKLLFMLLFIVSFSINYTDIDHNISKLVIGLCSIPAIIALMRTEWSKKAQFLVFWGTMTFPIYLLNTITIGVTKGVVLKFTTWDNQNFLFIAPLLLLAGMYGPIFIKKYIFPHFKYLDKITS